VIEPDLLAWPIGLVSAVVTALLLWPIGARLGLDPASRSTAAALYATAAALVELNAPMGVDGQGTMLLTAAACLAVGRRPRNALAALLTGLAIAVSPVTAVGFLVLLAAMALFGVLAKRLGPLLRRILAVGAMATAAAVATTQVRPELALALPPPAAGVLSLWVLVVVSVLWQRMRWLRSVGVALLAMLACCWLPGPDADAVVVVAAVGGVLTAMLAAEAPGVLLRRTVTAAVGVFALAAVAVVPGDIRQSPAAAAIAAAPAAQVQTVADPVPVDTVRPVTISIPALGVDGPLEKLAADPVSGELKAPDDPSKAGWYAAGVIPGDAGPAVVGGHVDSRSGPGVFFELDDLQSGDEIQIARSDGRTVRFVVTTVGRYPKSEFPTSAVYGPAPGPELRLVTCGGQFDRAKRSYRDNIVVDAILL
jgi:Sortase domain